MKNKLAESRARVALVTVAVFFTLLPVSTQSSGPVHPETQSNKKLAVNQVKELPEKSKRFALVIGVDEYQDTQISRLAGAANDAKALANALARYAGFPRDQVILLASDQPTERQPTRGNILQYLSNLKGVVAQDGLLLVSFSGHGIERGGRGFLCPSDARIGGSIALLESTAVSVDLVREWIRQTRVRQVLIFLDACRNNPAGRGDEQNPLSDSFARNFNFETRNREVEAFATLYATNVGNVAYEYKEKAQGYFTWALVEGLKGEAANEKGEVTLAGLVTYLQEQVPKRVRMDLGEQKTQRPYAKTEGYKADELVISVTATVSTAPGKSGSSIDPAAMELEFWNSVKTSTDANDFKEYLAKYPNGTFAGLARNKIRVLDAASKSGGVQPGTESKPAETDPRPGGTSSPAGALGGLPLRRFGFDVVAVNSSGSMTSRRKGQAQYCVEDTRGISLELVPIPAGKFLMGSTELDREKPLHQVGVGSFYIGKYEVNQAQWRLVASLPKLKRDLNPDPSQFKGDNLPVEQVSWDEALEFCVRLSQATGRIYRLPTEAEWEYACRAGAMTPFAFGESIVPQLVNYDGTHPYAQAPKGTFRETTTSVGFMRVANGFGLFDMHGNVWEWCSDSWHENYDGAPTDGRSWVSFDDLKYRVVRGGSWSDVAHRCRSSVRYGFLPERRYGNVGFRVVASARTK